MSNEQLYLFGLPETRQAVVSLKVTAISVSPSEDRDALATKEAAAAVPGVIDATGGVWTPPETWMALVAKQAVATAAAEKEEEKDAEAGDEPGAAMVREDAAAAAMAAAEGLEANSQAAFAADAYAFGMVSWEVRVSMWLLRLGGVRLSTRFRSFCFRIISTRK